MRRIYMIAGVVVRELIHERIFYLLLSFGALAFSVSFLLGQLTYAERAKITLDFLLAAQQISLVLFSIFMTISLVQRETVQGTVAMVLAKPISRTSFLLGKYLGEIFTLWIVSVLMGTVTLAFCQVLGGGYSPLAVVQASMLIFLEAAVITAFTFLLAVALNGLTAAIVAFSVTLLGHMNDLAEKNVSNEVSKVLWKAIRWSVPNLEVLNMKTLASYHLALSPSVFGWACVYALFCALLYFSLAAFCFSRKDIT